MIKSYYERTYYLRTFVESLTYLKRSDQSLITLLIGGILLYQFPFYLIPMIFIMGYVVRVLRHILIGEEVPPVFDQWIKLFIDGMKACVIWYFYLLIVVANVWLLEVARGGESASPDLLRLLLLTLSPGGLVTLAINISHESVTAIEPTVNNVGPIKLYLLLALSLYVGAGAVANYAETGRFRSGFDLSALRPVFFSLKYACSWFIFFILWTFSQVLILLPYTAEGKQFLVEIGIWLQEYGVLALGVELFGVITIFGSILAFVLFLAAFYILGWAWHEPESKIPNRVTILSKKLLSWVEEHSASTIPVTAQTLFLGALLLSLGSFFLLVFVVGYLLQVLRYSLDERSSLPSFEDWRALGKNGFAGLFIWACYLAVPCLLALLWLRLRIETVADLDASFPRIAREYAILSDFVSLGLGGAISGNLVTLFLDIDGHTLEVTANYLYSSGADFGVFAVVVLFAFGISLLVALYSAPAALVMFSETERLRDAFAVDALLPILLTEEYARIWRRIIGLWLIWGIPMALLHQYMTIAQFEGREFFMDPIVVGNVPVMAALTLEGLLYYLLAISLNIVAFFILVITYSLLGENWQSCRACVTQAKNGRTKSFIATLKPRRSYVMPFITLSVPGLLLLTWSGVPQFGVVVAATYLPFSYAATMIIVQILALDTWSKRLPRFRSVLTPSNRTISLLGIVWFLAVSFIFIFWLSADLFNDFLFLVVVLWLPNLLGIFPPVDIAFTLTLIASGLWLCTLGILLSVITGILLGVASVLVASFTTGQSPQRKYALLFFILSTPGFAVLWWESSLLIHMTLSMIVICISYVSSVKIIQYIAYDTWLEQRPKLNGYIIPFRSAIAPTAAIWLLSVSFRPLYWLSIDWFNLLLPVYRILWLPLFLGASQSIGFVFILALITSGLWLCLLGTALRLAIKVISSASKGIAI